MASSINVLILSGNLGREPEMIYTEKGLAVTNFSVAVGVWDGQKRAEATMWVKVVCFDKLAERCNTYLKKGSKVEVVGSLRIREYNDKDGNRRWSTECLAKEVNFIGGIVSNLDKQQEDEPAYEPDPSHPF